MGLGATLTLGEVSTKHYDEYVPRDVWDNVRYRREMVLMAGDDPLAAAQMRTLCAEDPLFYCNTFCYSYSPKDSAYGDPRTPFTTYDFQSECILSLLDCINKGRDAATPKSREVGASWMCLTAIEWCWHFRDYLSFLMVSRNQDLVDKLGDPGSLFWKLDWLHQYQPRWLLPRDRWLMSKDPGRKLLHLRNADNGSVIDGESTTGNIGVGDRRTAILFDEFALVEKGYAVLSGSRDVTNSRLFNSTPRGQNHFYEVCTNTAALVIRMHWSRHPLKNQGLYVADAETGVVEHRDDFRGEVEVFDKGEKEPRVVLYPEEYPFVKDGKIRSPWYDHQCNRCVSPQEIAQELDIDFLGSDYQFFDAESIEALKKKYCRPALLKGDLEYDPITLYPKRFREHKDGRLLLWITLDGNGRLPRDMKFAMGSDVSAGTGASNSVSCVVDRRTGEKVAAFKNPHLLPTPFGGFSVAMARFFNDAYMAWDRSGPTGEVFTKVVVKAGYGHIYYRRDEKKIDRRVTDEPGCFLNPQAKTVLFEDYRDALGNHRYINRSEQGMTECLQFIRKPDGSIEHSASMNSQDPSGARTAHGDEVVADALACLGMMERESLKEPEQPDVPVGSLAWRQRMRAEELVGVGEDRLDDTW